MLQQARSLRREGRILNPRLAQLRRKADADLAAFALAKQTLRAAEGRLEACREALGHAKAAQALAQAVAVEAQTQAHKRLAEVVTRALAAVFEEPYRFELAFTQSRGRTEVGLRFLRGGNEVDPMYGAGGGVLDIAGFALRIAAILVARPPLRRLIVADEPLRNLSRNHRERAAALMMKLAEELDFQLILITHDSEYELGLVHTL